MSNRKCVVIFCKNKKIPNSDKNFFSFPSVRTTRREDIPEGIAQRQTWVRAIARTDLVDGNLAIKNCIICSDHFVSGKPASPNDLLNVDYAPSLYLGRLGLINRCEPVQSGVHTSEILKRRLENANSGEIAHAKTESVTNSSNKSQFAFVKCEYAEPIDSPSTSSSTTDDIAKRKRLSDEQVDDLLTKIGERLRASYDEDEFNIFGKHVAVKLRGLPKETKLYTVKLINDLLFEAERGNIDKNSKIVTNSKAQDHTYTTVILSKKGKNQRTPVQKAISSNDIIKHTEMRLPQVITVKQEVDSLSSDCEDPLKMTSS